MGMDGNSTQLNSTQRRCASWAWTVLLARIVTRGHLHPGPHTPSHALTCPHTPSHALTCPHTPSHALPPGSHACPHMPSTCPHTPSTCPPQVAGPRNSRPPSPRHWTRTACSPAATAGARRLSRSRPTLRLAGPTRSVCTLSVCTHAYAPTLASHLGYTHFAWPSEDGLRRQREGRQRLLRAALAAVRGRRGARRGRCSPTLPSLSALPASWPPT